MLLLLCWLLPKPPPKDEPPTLPKGDGDGAGLPNVDDEDPKGGFELPPPNGDGLEFALEEKLPLGAPKGEAVAAGAPPNGDGFGPPPPMGPPKGDGAGAGAPNPPFIEVPKPLLDVFEDPKPPTPLDPPPKGLGAALPPPKGCDVDALPTPNVVAVLPPPKGLGAGALPRKEIGPAAGGEPNGALEGVPKLLFIFDGAESDIDFWFGALVVAVLVTPKGFDTPFDGPPKGFVFDFDCMD